MISSSSRKVHELAALADILTPLRADGKKIVHAHGVFDLLHPGHIRHLDEAKTLGDVLVVTVTEDQYVNKGPHRPAFTDALRAESLAALASVDFVAISRWPTAVAAIDAIRPHVYVKGPDYRDAADDPTGAIVLEENAVAAHGGTLHITDDVTFSSSALINRYVPAYPGDVQAYLHGFRSRYSAAEVIGYLDRLRDLRVLVVGEAILDEYIYCDQMGKSAKEPVLAMRYNDAETFAGGALAVANHLADFCASVDLVTYLGSRGRREEFVRAGLKPQIRLHHIVKANAPTIVKRRYVEASLLTKLFEVYVIEDDDVTGAEEAQLGEILRAQLAQSDAVVVADYGHGLLTPSSKDLLAARAPFLAVNTQINAANIRFHAISSYPRADYVCINEAELRLDARDRTGAVDDLVAELATKLDCKRFLVTRGRSGVRYFDGGATWSSPSLAGTVVDKIGAGDAVLAVTSLGVAAGMPPEVVAFTANVIGAQKVQIMGNRSAIDRASTVKFVASLLK
jgi:rfaE bifunctional protein kinase chain/domain/rfaE bifunctional protein nucleotidyltransferase chain/domain